MVALDRASQAVKFVQTNIVNRSGFSIGENNDLSDKLGLHVAERGEDRRCAELRSRHVSNKRFSSGLLPLNNVQVVTLAGQACVEAQQPGSTTRLANAIFAASKNERQDPKIRTGLFGSVAGFLR